MKRIVRHGADDIGRMRLRAADDRASLVRAVRYFEGPAPADRRLSSSTKFSTRHAEEGWASSNPICTASSRPLGSIEAILGMPMLALEPSAIMRADSTRRRGSETTGTFIPRPRESTYINSSFPASVVRHFGNIPLSLDA